MSSPEFAELRGISGVALSARAAALMSNERRALLWFIQAKSLCEGGLKRFVRELELSFPKEIRAEDDQDDDSPWRSNEMGLEQFLIDLCINPRLRFSAPDESDDLRDIEEDRAMAANPEMSRVDFEHARLYRFPNIVKCLFEIKSRQERAAKEKFFPTEIGKRVWNTLDYALASGGMVVIDGLEGRGKTEAAKAWCACHQGLARFVSLKGITNKTTAFREISKALGIAATYTRTVPQLQARIEDVLARSKIMLVVDEAHFVFNQSRCTYTRPELVDWIDTAICNRGVPIALVTTPQFIVCMTRAADQVQWNYRQFRRRVRRWEKLPAINTEEDIKSVARHVFPKASGVSINEIAGYSLLCKRDLSAIGDVASEVRVMLGHADLGKATAAQIHTAIYDFLLPSDATFTRDMKAAREAMKPGRPRKPFTLPADDHPAEAQAIPAPPKVSPMAVNRSVTHELMAT